MRNTRAADLLRDGHPIFHALVRVPDREQWLRAKFGATDTPDAANLAGADAAADATGVAVEEAPEAREKREEKLYAHLRTLYTKDYVQCLRKGVEELRAKGRGEDAEKVLESFRWRSCDVNVWTKEVKQRFSKWLNKRRERRGTLWMEKFKSVLVQVGEALRTMALYIDLNPVRAGIAGEPAEYRWSGYGAAAEEAEAVMKAGGRMPLGQALGLRMRRMTDGLVPGSQAGVEEVYAAYREQFGRKRKVGARPLRGVEGGMCTLRG